MTVIEDGQIGCVQLERAFASRDNDCCKFGFSNIAHKSLGQNVYGMETKAQVVVTGKHRKTVRVTWRDCSTGQWGNRYRTLGKFTPGQSDVAIAAIQSWLDE